MLALLLTLLAPAPSVIDFATIPLEDARRMAGTKATVTLEVTAMPWIVQGVTMGGTGSDERMIYLQRGTAEEGDKIRATGVIRVVTHPAALANGVVVPSWTEI